MGWAITLYPNYGTIETLYSKLRNRWKRVEICEEFSPYHHYHAFVKDSYTKADKYQNHIKWLNRLSHTKAPHKIYLSVVDDEKHYMDYIRKEKNKCLSNLETEKENIVNKIAIERNIMSFIQIDDLSGN